MSISVALTVLALIVPAELPDKTFVASLVLATRYKAVPVLIGVAFGFAVQSGIAVAAGSAVGLLPKSLVHGVSAGIFAIGAILMLRSVENPDEEQREVEKELEDAPAEPSALRVAMTSFVVLFVAEWGDLTQILTASLSAKYKDPAAVFLGSFVGLMIVAVAAVIGGKALLRVMPLDWVRRVAALAFAVIAVITALQAANVL